jgi:hypothetical protein
VVQIASIGPDGCERDRYDHVINASWDSLVNLDSTAGITAPNAYTYRVKHFLRLAGGPLLLSATIVLGRFGDVVSYGDGSLFLSWYPIGQRGMTVNASPPDWAIPLKGREAEDVRQGTIDGLANVVPGLDSLSEVASFRAEMRGGIIYAMGSTDVDDPVSGLHQRHAVGPRSFGRYHSINTGKYSFAPFFAEMLAERIVGPT